MFTLLYYINDVMVHHQKPTKCTLAPNLNLEHSYCCVHAICTECCFKSTNTFVHGLDYFKQNCITFVKTYFTGRKIIQGFYLYEHKSR